MFENPTRKGGKEKAMGRWKAPMELPRRNSLILYLSVAVFVVLLGIAQVGSPGSGERWYARSALAKVWWPVEGSDLGPYNLFQLY